MYDKLISKEAKLCVIGLGYVGLPIALQFAKNISVIGFDINEERVNMMKNKGNTADNKEKQRNSKVTCKSKYKFI